MKVVYFLDGSALYGGTKVVYQHALGLRRLGIDAEVVSTDGPPHWFPGAVDFYRQVPRLNAEAAAGADIVVGTNWFTVPSAASIPGAVPFHLCQCYEAAYTAIRDQWPAIEAVYRLPTRKLAVSDHLVKTVTARTGQPCRLIPQPFRPDLFCPPEKERPPDGTFRLLLAGQWSIPIKGVEWAMRALRPLAFEEPPLTLVRLSQDSPEQEVELWPEAERSVQLPIDLVPDLLRGVDAYLGPSTDVEGFGLPTLEAFGCARPAVLSDVGANRSIDPQAFGSIRFPVGDDEALRAAVRRLRGDATLRRSLGEKARQLAAGYTEERTAKELLDAYSSALGREPREEVATRAAIGRSVISWRREVDLEAAARTDVRARLEEVERETLRLRREVASLNAAFRGRSSSRPAPGARS